MQGKAVCEDMCFSASSFTSATGPVLNPVNPAHSAGGSSSGCAALVSQLLHKSLVFIVLIL